MSKKRHVKAKNVKYNRMSKGYQKNAVRSQMKESGIKIPDKATQQKRAKLVKYGGIAWLVALIVVAFRFRLTGVIIVLAVGIVLAGGMLFYLDREEKKIIKACKTAGMTKEQYMNEGKRRKLNPGRLNTLSKLWDKVPDPE